MLALVTGATGCVGANVVEALLSRGYTVRAMHRSTSRLDALEGLSPDLVAGDIMDPPSLARAMEGVDLVFHTAAISQYWRNRTSEVMKVNIEGTRNVLDAARKQDVRRVVFTSSVAALGFPARPGQVLDESAQFNLKPKQFPYGYSKHLAELEVRRAVGDGLDAVIVNPVSVVGQRDVNFLGGELLRSVQRRLMFAVPPGGMGIVSARDTGLAHVLAAEKGTTGERYILNSAYMPFRELVVLIAGVVGQRVTRLVLPTPVIHAAAAVLSVTERLGLRFIVQSAQLHLSTRLLYYDGSKARRSLGFTPIPVRDAIVEAWLWYRSHGQMS